MIRRPARAASVAAAKISAWMSSCARMVPVVVRSGIEIRIVSSLNPSIGLARATSHPFAVSIAKCRPLAAIGTPLPVSSGARRHPRRYFCSGYGSSSSWPTNHFSCARPIKNWPFGAIATAAARFAETVWFVARYRSRCLPATPRPRPNQGIPRVGLNGTNYWIKISNRPSVFRGSIDFSVGFETVIVRPATGRIGGLFRAR